MPANPQYVQMSSSKKPLSLFLTRITPAIWAQFYHWYELRNEDHRPVQPPSGHGVWVVCESKEPVKVGDVEVGGPLLVAGCCLFPCDGPYIVVEFVSVNPSLSARLRHDAVTKVCMAVNYYGAMVGKTPLCFPKHKGVKRLMKKTGYVDVKPEVEVLFSPFFVPVGVFEEENRVFGPDGVPVEPATLEAVQHG